jgi:hypothetical protein
METLEHPHHNILQDIWHEIQWVIHEAEKKIWFMFSKEHHTLGEFILLYLIIFVSILVLLLVFETVH